MIIGYKNVIGTHTLSRINSWQVYAHLSVWIPDFLCTSLPLLAVNQAYLINRLASSGGRGVESTHICALTVRWKFAARTARTLETGILEECGH